ncbi:hypothetical protein CMV_023083 [Castanea mollissima]|uniref:Uncharacterized protein n=1 Tax=Castanea mollissima TaxID=60419 RepID=A0A8J4QQZ3_9ROSI|nr:hypothetical protein CMV_023083 [Castanea mollissima]
MIKLSLHKVAVFEYLWSLVAMVGYDVGVVGGSGDGSGFAGGGGWWRLWMRVVVKTRSQVIPTPVWWWEQSKPKVKNDPPASQPTNQRPTVPTPTVTKYKRRRSFPFLPQQTSLLPTEFPLPLENSEKTEFSPKSPKSSSPPNIPHFPLKKTKSPENKIQRKQYSRVMENSTQESQHQHQQNSITHEAPYPLYSLAISPSPTRSHHYRIAVGSFIETYNNRVDILSFDPETLSLKPLHPSLSFDHPYPPTKLMFHPTATTSSSSSSSPSNPNPNLLASSGDFIRLWDLRDHSIEPLCVLNNSKTSEFCAPLTSFDWNEVEPKRIGTCSIDTTCTVWDIERCVVETQLIAHDKEVYDIAWGEARVFASVSADGSVRIFDLRDKEHSTIIYESPQPDTPLLRLAWNKQDLRYMATILMDSNKVVILDIRSPTMPVAELERHKALESLRFLDGGEEGLQPNGLALGLICPYIAASGRKYFYY